MKQLVRMSALILAILGVATTAMAAQPTPWELGFQEPASPMMHKINDFHNLLLYIIFAISAFVLLLLAYVIIRFRKSKNPTPSKTSHNTMIEIIWTVIPVMILIVIIIPSMRLLYFTERNFEPELTLKVTGYQWYWGYEYPDHQISFDSNMIPENQLTGDQLRLLSVDNPIVLPIETNIQVLVTAGDVLHAWAVPAFGVKVDSVPGRLNETWVRIEKEGRYYGQCSELCGQGHAFMPIEIIAVSKEAFQEWVARGGKTTAALAPQTITLSSNQK